MGRHPDTIKNVKIHGQRQLGRVTFPMLPAGTGTGPEDIKGQSYSPAQYFPNPITSGMVSRLAIVVTTVIWIAISVLPP